MGGTPVTITGTGFIAGTGNTTVMFGTNPGMSVNVSSNTSLTVITPPGGSAGPVGVVVSTIISPAATQVNGYTYLTVGMPFQGGVTACLYGGLNNLIASDLIDGNFRWGNSNETTNAGSDSNGESNTNTIVSTVNFAPAAFFCHDFTGGGFTDWFLPSKNQLACLYENRVAVGGFESAFYWSSTETRKVSAWALNFNADYLRPDPKSYAYKIRCVRAPS